MFLSLLTSEQKKLFISFAYDLAFSDGNFSEKEKVLLKNYSMEMGMEIKQEDINGEINSIISEISRLCGHREKKIIIFEAIGLAMADYNYDEAERKVLKEALNTFGIDSEFGDYCEEKIREYLCLQEEINMKILQ